MANDKRGRGRPEIGPRIYAALDSDDVAWIDSVRGRQPRAQWIRDAVTQRRARMTALAIMATGE